MRNKLKAFAIHLGISFVIALLSVALVFFVWYPAPLHKALGVTGIFLLLLVIDVILGPVLTFVVYKKGKRTLVMDLAVIALLQVAALSYGLWTVAEGRPAWLVFGGNHFELVRKIDIDPHELTREPSWWGPEWVSVREPLTLNRSLFSSNTAGSNQSLYRQPANYRALELESNRIRQRALPLSLLERSNPAEQVEAVLSQWPTADGWFVLQGKEQSMVVLVNRETAKVLAVVDLRS